jgi:hypothetical protein
MGWFGARKPAAAAAAKAKGEIPRRAERYQTSGLSCPLGGLCDLSASGMQIKCPRRPAAARGEVRQFIISSGAQRLSVTGRVVWVKRTSWRGFRLGIHFLHLKPGVEAALVQLAKYGFVGGTSDQSCAARPEGPRAAMEVEDLYQILGLGPGATPGEIHAAYRTLARTLHPDICRDPDAVGRFVLVGKAYSVLKDPDRRRKYDRLLAICA